MSLLVCLLTAAAANAAILSDTLPAFNKELEEIEVRGNHRLGMERREGVNTLSPDMLKTGARVLGETDIVAVIRQQPAVVTEGDFASGISVEGGEPYQSVFLVDGAPVFFPYRFGGIFSTFNTSQFSKATFYRSGPPPGSPSRLGGVVELESDNPFGRPTHLLANASLMAATASLRHAFSRKFGITASARLSYMNLLYRPLLKQDGYRLGYDFNDLNLCLFLIPDSLSSLRISLFWNSDKLEMIEKEFDLDMGIVWHNFSGALEYKRQWKKSDLRLTLYSTGFGSDLNVAIPSLEASMPSTITSSGVSGSIRRKIGRGVFESIELGGEIAGWRVRPQYVDIAEGRGVDQTPVPLHRYAGEVQLSAGIELNLPGHLELRPEAGGAFYSGEGGFRDWSFLPALRLSRRMGKHWLSLSAETRIQPVHQVGFSEIGLASNYWIIASRRLPVGTAHKANLSWEWDTGWQNLRLAADGYIAKVGNQAEHTAGVLAALDAGYDPEDPIRICHGWNSGVSLEAVRNCRNLSTILTLGWSSAVRRFEGESQWWRSSYDAGFRMALRGSLRLGTHWVLDASFVFNQGRPYTPTKAMYLISGNLASEYAKRNSARFAAYQRLDLSATYRWKSHRNRFSHLLNLSLLNAYGHKNTEMLYYRIDLKTGRFGLKEIFSIYRFLPSLGYTFEM